MNRVFPMVLLAIFLSAASVQAGGERAMPPDSPTLYARGCYWHRGVRRCSQYCYVEINGTRYCRNRESEAVPQGNPYAYERPTVGQIYRQPR